MQVCLSELSLPRFLPRHPVMLKPHPKQGPPTTQLTLDALSYPSLQPHVATWLSPRRLNYSNSSMTGLPAPAPDCTPNQFSRLQNHRVTVQTWPRPSPLLTLFLSSAFGVSPKSSGSESPCPPVQTHPGPSTQWTTCASPFPQSWPPERAAYSGKSYGTMALGHQGPHPGPCAHLPAMQQVLGAKGTLFHARSPHTEPGAWVQVILLKALGVQTLSLPGPSPSSPAHLPLPQPHWGSAARRGSVLTFTLFLIIKAMQIRRIKIFRAFRKALQAKGRKGNHLSLTTSITSAIDWTLLNST